MPFGRSFTSGDVAAAGSEEISRRRRFSTLPVSSGKKHLPQPRGPHSVGYVDVMTPGNPVAETSSSSSPGNPGTFVRILYPTQEQCLSEHDRWPVWVEDKYLTGMLGFMQTMLANWPSWAPQSEYFGISQMSYISPFIPHTGFPTLFRFLNGVVHVPIIKGARPDSSRQWPVIVFSHGLGCARSIYSRICYDLASYGFVVMAPEHRDGSACASYYLEADPVSGSLQTEWIPHKRIPVDQHELKERNWQAHFRVGEVSRSLDIITALNKGEEVVNLVDPDRSFDYGLLKGRVDLSKPIVAGHSFGGATAVLSLAKDPRFEMGVALDAWLFPLKEESIAEDVTKPMKFISTESFKSPQNLSKMSEFKSDRIDRIFCYIKGSVHQNHLDAPFIVQNALARKIVGMHSETCPEIVIDLNNKMMVQFIWKHLGTPEDKDIDSDIEKQSSLIMQLFPVDL